jgi:hypothetical protein
MIITLPDIRRKGNRAEDYRILPGALSLSLAKSLLENWAEAGGCNVSWFSGGGYAVALL